MRKSTSFGRKIAKKVANHILCEIKRLYGVSNEACDDCKLHTSKLQTSHYTFAIVTLYDCNHNTIRLCLTRFMLSNLPAGLCRSPFSRSYKYIMCRLGKKYRAKKYNLSKFFVSLPAIIKF